MKEKWYDVDTIELARETNILRSCSISRIAFTSVWEHWCIYGELSGSNLWSLGSFYETSSSRIFLTSSKWIFTRLIPFYFKDEIFHIPQVQKYCAGDFTYWDKKITTFPGLYLVSLVFHGLLSFSSKKIFGVAPSCSIFVLRLFNTCMAGMFPLLCNSCRRKVICPEMIWW